MDVILLGNIRNLGALGDRVTVKPGYARNYLIPQSKAVYATAENILKFDERRAELEKIAAEKHSQSVARQQQLNALPALTIVVKAGEEGKLFGSIGTRDIIDALNKAGVEVEKREVSLPHGTLRELGEHPIAIELDSDVSATITINLVSEG